MPFSAKAVANSFLELAEESGETLSPMKIQKLVYFAHGWHLALFDAPLIDEQVEAWKFGPVIKSLYHEFKHFGNNAIKGRATSFRMVRGNRLRIQSTTPAIPISPATQNTRDLIQRVWDVYSKYSAVQLSNLTHAPGTPWKQVIDSCGGHILHGTDIPVDIIQNYFKSQM